MDLPNRKTVRLADFDYSKAGVYFITICTHEKEMLFGNVAGSEMFSESKVILSEIGKMADQEIHNIEKHYDNVKIDHYVIMPNHIHLLIRITERINPFPTARGDIPNIIGKFKAAVSRSVGKAFMPSGREKLWQNSFYDHIIRDEWDYREKWDYISNNPARWSEDRLYV